MEKIELLKKEMSELLDFLENDTKCGVEWDLCYERFFEVEKEIKEIEATMH